MWIGDLTLRLRNWIAEVAQDGPFGNHATLTDGLVSYWALDELSGTRYDSVTATGNDLTDNNTVTYRNQGPEGTVASYTAASSEYLSHSGIPAVTGSNGVTVVLWMKIPSSGASANTGYMLYGDSMFSGSGISFDSQGAGAGYVVAYVFNDAGDFKGGTIGGGVMDDDQWHMYAVTYDPADLKVRISLDGGTQTASNALSGHPAFNSGNIFIGKVATNYVQGQNARVAVWNRTLSQADINAIFNSGVGKGYSDLTTDELVSLVNYWNLDEVSGARYDSHGSNDLTDNNTVGSVNSGPEGVVADSETGNAEHFTGGPAYAADAAFTITGWFKPESDTGSWQALVEDGAATNLRIRVTTGAGGAVQLVTRGTNDIHQSVTMGNTVGQWWFLAAYHDPAGNLLGTSINGEAFTTTATGGANGAITAVSILGRPGVDWFDGQSANIGFYSSVLSLARVQSLFNAGVGKRYAELTDADKVDLVSYYDFTETSGTRADAHGSSDLTDVNTVGYTINKGGASEGVGANFVAASSEYLSRTDSATTVWGEDGNGCTFAGWVKLTNSSSYGLIFGRATPDGTNRGFEVYTENNAATPLYAGGTFGGTALQASIAYVVGTNWHFLCAWFDPADSKTHISINNQGEQVSAAAAGNTLAATSHPIAIGGGWTYGSLGGQVDEVGIWNRVLTAQERTDLFNAGKGLFYGD